jgi:hypothetical protein
MNKHLQNRRSGSSVESRACHFMEKWFADRQQIEALHAIEGHYYLSRDDSTQHRLSAILPMADPADITYIQCIVIQ